MEVREPRQNNAGATDSQSLSVEALRAECAALEAVLEARCAAMEAALRWLRVATGVAMCAAALGVSSMVALIVFRSVPWFLGLMGAAWAVFLVSDLAGRKADSYYTPTAPAVGSKKVEAV